MAWEKRCSSFPKCSEWLWCPPCYQLLSGEQSPFPYWWPGHVANHFSFGAQVKNGRTVPLHVHTRVPVALGTWTYVQFLACSQNCEKLCHACLSIHPHGTTQLPLDRFSRNFIFENFKKSVEKNQVSLKSDQNNVLYMKVYVTYMIIPHSVSLRMRNVSNKRCTENQNTHFVFNNFFPKIVPFMR